MLKFVSSLSGAYILAIAAFVNGCESPPVSRVSGTEWSVEKVRALEGMWLSDRGDVFVASYDNKEKELVIGMLEYNTGHLKHEVFNFRVKLSSCGKVDLLFASLNPADGYYCCQVREMDASSIVLVPADLEAVRTLALSEVRTETTTNSLQGEREANTAVEALEKKLCGLSRDELKSVFSAAGKVSFKKLEARK